MIKISSGFHIFEKSLFLSVGSFVVVLQLFLCGPQHVFWPVFLTLGTAPRSPQRAHLVLQCCHDNHEFKPSLKSKGTRRAQISAKADIHSSMMSKSASRTTICVWKHFRTNKTWLRLYGLVISALHLLCTSKLELFHVHCENQNLCFHSHIWVREKKSCDDVIAPDFPLKPQRAPWWLFLCDVFTLILGPWIWIVM